MYFESGTHGELRFTKAVFSKQAAPFVWRCKVEYKGQVRTKSGAALTRGLANYVVDKFINDTVKELCEDGPVGCDRPWLNHWLSNHWQSRTSDLAHEKTLLGEVGR